MGPFFFEKDPDGNSKNKNYWYEDVSLFPGSGDPWFLRGGHFLYGTGTGIFAFGCAGGSNQYGSYSFRVVLTPQE